MSRRVYTPQLGAIRFTASMVAASVVVGCASSGATTRRAAPAPAVTARVDSAALPQLAVDQISDGGVSAQRVRHFDAVNQDVRLVVRALAENFGMGHQIDPDVKGHVNTRLENATLEQALATVLGPLGYAYQVEGGVVRVSGMRLQTQIFSLDYVSLNRVGTTSTIVTRRVSSQGAFSSNVGISNISQLGQAGFGGGGFGGGGISGGGESITSVTAADLWAEIRVALETLVFEAASDTGARVQSVQSGTPMAGQAGFGGIGMANTGASGRSSADGRQLIVNPLAGTILVTAPPAKLAQVEAYLAAVQSAVQRQVLIEAKIVEVELRREFRFGIDWRSLSETARLGINFAGARNLALAPANTVTLTLGGGDSRIELALQALESQGAVSVLASPMLSALHNQPAVFDATQDEVFFSITRQPIIGPTGTIVSFNTQVVPQQISVGIVLNVLANIGADQVITMNIRPGLSDVTGSARQALPEGGEVVVPIISRRETDTMARVRAGETIIIGGLTRTRRRRDRSGVPILQDIPGVGGLFRTTEHEDLKNEIVIFLTPTIIAGSSTATAVR
jgi:MSHA biogenesis protein MshL